MGKKPERKDEKEAGDDKEYPFLDENGHQYKLDKLGRRRYRSQGHGGGQLNKWTEDEMNEALTQ